jgi:hypothetical protein
MFGAHIQQRKAACRRQYMNCITWSKLCFQALLITDLAPIGCMSRAHSRHSWVGESHVWSPYSAQLSCVSSSLSKTNTRISWVGASHVWSALSSLVRFMSKDRTRILSVGASHTSRTYSAQIGCRSSVNTRITFLAQIVFGAHIKHKWTVCRAPIHLFRQIVRVVLRVHLQHRWAECRRPVHEFHPLVRVSKQYL